MCQGRAEENQRRRPRHLRSCRVLPSLPPSKTSGFEGLLLGPSGGRKKRPAPSFRANICGHFLAPFSRPENSRRALRFPAPTFAFSARVLGRLLKLCLHCKAAGSAAMILHVSGGLRTRGLLFGRRTRRPNQWGSVPCAESGAGAATAQGKVVSTAYDPLRCALESLKSVWGTSSWSWATLSAHMAQLCCVGPCLLRSWAARSCNQT